MIPGPNLRQTQMNPVDRINTEVNAQSRSLQNTLVIIGIVQVGRQRQKDHLTPLQHSEKYKFRSR